MQHSDSDPSRLLQLKLLVARLRIESREQRDRGTASLGGAVGRFGRRLVLRVHRNESIPMPPPIVVGDHRFDVVDDLQRYTRLPAAQVKELIERRSDSFRAEWFLTPADRRVDDWFYLASTAYLFGNAVHDPVPFLDLVGQIGATPGRALDYGGGTGNLALALAAAGWSVDHLERSALQKDFVAFRIQRHGLGDRVRILDEWQPLERGAYDLVSAIDVLEHVADLDHLLVDELLPALRPDGRLAESSPFVRNLSNPMHHEHEGLEELLGSHDFHLEADAPVARVWRRRPSP